MNAPPSHDWTSIPEILDTSAAWLAYTRGKRFCKDRLVGRICGLCCDQAGGVFELRVLSEAAPDIVPDFWDFRHGQLTGFRSHRVTEFLAYDFDALRRRGRYGARAVTVAVAISITPSIG
jgi:hypothetical protein